MCAVRAHLFFFGLWQLLKLRMHRINSLKNNYRLTENETLFIIFFLPFFLQIFLCFLCQYLRPIHCHGHGFHTRLSQYFPKIWRWHTKFFWVEERRTLKKGKYRGYTVGPKSYMYSTIKNLIFDETASIFLQILVCRMCVNLSLKNDFARDPIQISYKFSRGLFFISAWCFS
jgi:hypothetical protein